jgi:hypothetical protein
MICIEIEDNLARLREFPIKANEAPTFRESPLSAMQKCDALRLKALPTFNHSVWRSLMASIPTALSSRKITRVYRFHGQLDGLVVLKERHDLVPSEHADAARIRPLTIRARRRMPSCSPHARQSTLG